MRTYNIYQCPICKGFEYRTIPRRKWVCKKGRKEEEIDVDPKYDNSLLEPPPMCAEFILEGRK